jgi:hypothetical protein
MSIESRIQTLCKDRWRIENCKTSSLRPDLGRQVEKQLQHASLHYLQHSFKSLRPPSFACTWREELHTALNLRDSAEQRPPSVDHRQA